MGVGEGPQGAVACCCGRGPGSSPPLLSVGSAGWLPSQFLCSNRTRGKAHGCLSISPWSVCGSPACLSVPLSVSLFLSPLHQRPAPTSHFSLLPSQFQGHNKVTSNYIPEKPDPLFTSSEHRQRRVPSLQQLTRGGKESRDGSCLQTEPEASHSWSRFVQLSAT